MNKYTPNILLSYINNKRTTEAQYMRNANILVSKVCTLPGPIAQPSLLQVLTDSEIAELRLRKNKNPQGGSAEVSSCAAKQHT